MAERFVLPVETAFDNNGDPISGAKLNFYTTGTSSRVDTYSDSALAVANTNPVVADSAGRFGSIFLGTGVTYKVVLTDADDVVIWTRDPVAAPAGVSEASQAEVDARTTTSKYVSPAKIADGTGLQGSSIFSAAALTLPTAGDYFSITGTTSITSISSRTAGREVTLVFAAALTLTHNATSLILPAAANITTAAGDSARMRSEGAGNWRCVAYTKASGFPILSKCIVSAASNGLTSGSTWYLGLVGASTTESDGFFAAPFTGTLRNMRARVSGNGPGAGQTITFTLRTQGVDTTLTCVISGAGSSSGSDTTHTVTLNTGDVITVKAVTSAGAATMNAAVTFELDVTA
jgi:hypothetical protein